MRVPLSKRARRTRMPDAINDEQVTDAQEETPVPLLAQAEQRLRATRAAERATRRAVEDRPPHATWDDVAQAAKARRQAQDALDQVCRGLAQVQQALPEAQRDLAQAEGELAGVVETARKNIYARRRCMLLKINDLYSLSLANIRLIELKTYA